MKLTEEQVPKLPTDDVPRTEIGHVLKELTAQMELASSNLEFEKAALLRDQITELEKRRDAPRTKKKHAKAQSMPKPFRKKR